MQVGRGGPGPTGERTEVEFWVNTSDFPLEAGISNSGYSWNKIIISTCHQHRIYIHEGLLLTIGRSILLVGKVFRSGFSASGLVNFRLIVNKSVEPV